MSEWVRLCGVEEAPAEGALVGVEVEGRTVCLSRVSGVLRGMDGICPHRGAPLAEGWVDAGKVVCPWHSWEFDCGTGEAAYPAGEKVAVYGVRVEDGEVLVDFEGRG